MKNAARPIAVAALVGLAACAATEAEMVEQGIEPLDAAAIERTFGGNTIRVDGDGWTHHSFMGADGAIRGTSTWRGGSESATGIREVSADGLWCRDRDNDRAGGGYGCAAAYPAEGEDDDVLFHRRGTKSSVTRFEATVLEGNPRDL